MGDAGARSGDDGGSDPDGPADPDAFASLGNAIRLRTLVRLLEDAPQSFSELAAASGVDTTAGFAYHLGELRDRYVRKVDDSEDAGYVLTDAGQRVARAVRAGSYTTSVDRDPAAIADPCPLCGAGVLEASARDNTVAVACGACDRAILRLPFPPGGFRTHDDEALAAALSRQYRHRIALMTDGGCPECGGRVGTRVEAATPRLVPDRADDGAGLALFVAGDGRVVDTERFDAGDASESGTEDSDTRRRRTTPAPEE